MVLREHTRILSAIEAAGHIGGRKKLQKMVFISKKLEYPFQEKFEFHFYGPYSEELTLKIEELCNLGLLSEMKDKENGYVHYDYSLTDAGKEFLSLYGNHPENEELSACVKVLNNHNARFLELVSTIFYFDHLSKDEIVKKIQELKAKQHYTTEEIEEAFDYAEQLIRENKPMYAN
jgi:uncharacterized protein YwgA